MDERGYRRSERRTRGCVPAREWRVAVKSEQHGMGSSTARKEQGVGTAYTPTKTPSHGTYVLTVSRTACILPLQRHVSVGEQGSASDTSHATANTKGPIRGGRQQ